MTDPASGAALVFDRTKLAVLTALIGEAKAAAVVRQFKEELLGCLAAIEANAPHRAEHAHKLAGVAGMLGFADIEEKSQRFMEALEQSPENVHGSADALLQAARRAEQELTTLTEGQLQSGVPHLPRLPAPVTLSARSFG